MKTREWKITALSYLFYRVILCPLTSLLVFCCIPIFSLLLLLEKAGRLKPAAPHKPSNHSLI